MRQSADSPYHGCFPPQTVELPIHYRPADGLDRLHVLLATLLSSVFSIDCSAPAPSWLPTIRVVSARTFGRRRRRRRRLSSIAIVGLDTPHTIEYMESGC